jgi:hypothetical protein
MAPPSGPATQEVYVDREIINLTPHDIVVRGRRGPPAVIPRSGTTARLTQAVAEVDTLVYDEANIPVVSRLPGQVVLWNEATRESTVGLPGPEPSKVWLVSSIVRGYLEQAALETEIGRLRALVIRLGGDPGSDVSRRRDVVSPDSGGAVRNRDGDVVSISRLIL